MEKSELNGSSSARFAADSSGQASKVTVGEFTMQLVRAGQIVTFEVEGGWRRRPAPHDGLLVESTKTTILLPLDQLSKLLDLHRSEQQRRPQHRNPLEHAIRR